MPVSRAPGQGAAFPLLALAVGAFGIGTTEFGNIGAFNLGNALGAALGGVVLSAGFGYAAVSASGAALAGLGVVLVFLQAGSVRAAAAT